MKGLNHQVDEHDIGPNYIMLSSLIEIDDFVTTEGWAVFDYLRQLLERGSPDLPGCTRKRLAFKVYQHCKVNSTSTVSLEGGCSFFLLSFPIYRIGKSKFH